MSSDWACQYGSPEFKDFYEEKTKLQEGSVCASTKKITLEWPHTVRKSGCLQGK